MLELVVSPTENVSVENEKGSLIRFITGENCSYHPKIVDCRSNC